MSGPDTNRPVLALRSLLAMATAWVVVVLGNLLGGALANATGMPPPGQGRLAWDLGVMQAAGVIAVFVLVRLAPRAPRIHAIVFLLLALVIAMLGVSRLGSDWPMWFAMGALLGTPFQVLLGAWWGLRGR